MTGIGRRQWRRIHNPPVRAADPVFEIFEWWVPIGVVLMVVAATGLAKRSIVPVELSAIVVMVLAALLGFVEIAAMARMLFVSGVPRLSRTGTIALLSGTVCAPLILWIRGGLAVSSTVVVAVSINAALIAISTALVVLRRTLAGRSSREEPPSAAVAMPPASQLQRTRVRRSRGVWGAITQMPRMLGIALFIACAVVFALLWVNWIRLSFEPTYWGTFTELSCTPRVRGGCESVGVWTSDDGTIRLTDVELDGTVDESHTARALYMPGERGVDDPIVHVALSVAIAPALLPILVVWMSSLAFYYGRAWWGWGGRRARTPW